MNVGILVADRSVKSGGIFTYTNAVINTLIKDTRVERIVLFYSKDQGEYFKGIFYKEKKVQPYLVSMRYRRWLVKFYTFSNQLSEVTGARYQRYLWPLNKIAYLVNPYRPLFKNASIDVMHVPFQISPIYHIGCPVIITMHDLQELHFPEFFSAEDRVHRAALYKHAIEQSDHIIVSFEHVKKDILKYFNVPASKISVCLLSLAVEWFQHTDPTPGNVLADKYKLPKRFILYPAATWRHKNHINLMNALKILNNKETKISLICTGNQTEHYPKVAEEVKRLGLESQVRFLGIVPESDLIGLYKMTDLVVIPTLYEAGSGPLWESMRYEIPVVCSNVTSFPDAIGNPEFIFDPEEPAEIARLIEKGCFDKEFRARNIQNSKSRLEHYNDLDNVGCFADAYSRCKSSFTIIG